MGANLQGTISNCYSTGIVSGTYERIGGLVGACSNGTISNCYSTGDVSGEWYVGGLVGYNYYGNLSNSFSTGSVSGELYVGGCGIHPGLPEGVKDNALELARSLVG